MLKNIRDIVIIFCTLLITIASIKTILTIEKTAKIWIDMETSKQINFLYDVINEEIKNSNIELDKESSGKKG